MRRDDEIGTAAAQGRLEVALEELTRALDRLESGNQLLGTLAQAVVRLGEYLLVTRR